MSKLDLNKFEFEEKYKSLIEDLNYQQLQWLSDMVWDRMKLMSDLEYLAKTNMFKRGHYVGWEKDGYAYKGQVVKVNRKTIVVVESESKREWKIDPHFLYKI